MPLEYVKGLLLSKKISSGLCICSHCNNKPARYRKICHKHISDKFKEDNPIGFAFKVLKNNAKRRKISVEITKDEFTKWCIENDYIRLKGRFKDSLTIDRKISSIGYTYENMQILTNSQNVRKMWIEIKIRLGRYPTEEEILSIQPPIYESNQTSNTVEENTDLPF